MPLSTTTRDVSLAFAAGTLVGIASMAFFERRCRKRRRRRRQQSTLISCPSASDLPPFAHELAHNPDLHRIRLREWEDLEWRAKNGWKGHDLCHNHNEQQGGNAVRVLQYYFDEANTQMTGVVWFGPDAESHRGLCHGGAMSSLMDDFCGHMAFVDKPWSGATVQVNVSLKKPVKVGSVLRIHGRIRKKEGRKVHVEAVLDDGAANDPVVYAALEGLSIDGVKLSDHQDEVAERTWEVDVCKTSGRLQRQDSGWNKDE